MSVLVVSTDEHAVRALRSALERCGEHAAWAVSVTQAREQMASMPPLIVIVDEGLEEPELVRDILVARPWTRVKRLNEDGRADDPSVIIKPFDAGELAALLVRELEAARSDQQRLGLQSQLEHSERLAAIGRLSASMAHEISNPLAVISASLGFIADVARDTGNAELAECERDMALAVDRIRGFVNHINGFARRDRSRLRDADVESAVEGAFRMVRPRAHERQVQVHKEGQVDARVPHDPVRLSQAVLNLLANAVDAAAEGGKNAVVRVVDEPERVLIQVDDDGPGISPEVQPMLFQPFATTKPEGRGTGLGLSITRQIVHDHEGELTLSSLPAGGTRAEVRLEKLRPSAHTILIVEHDATVSRALASDLRREGFEVVACASAREALAAAPACSVVITEVALPDGSGADLLHRLSEQAPRVGRVAVTASERAVSSAQAQLSKPWNRDALVAAVRDLCAARAARG